MNSSKRKRRSFVVRSKTLPRKTISRILKDMIQGAKLTKTDIRTKYGVTSPDGVLSYIRRIGFVVRRERDAYYLEQRQFLRFKRLRETFPDEPPTKGEE